MFSQKATTVLVVPRSMPTRNRDFFEEADVFDDVIVNSEKQGWRKTALKASVLFRVYGIID
ncbi:hypothetical protein VCO01S_11580 [Vibrio comitans NBRC 102076]|uniref:Uncharacterized protein n=1 Tax=Vibrio comitans NBRC 102076 TaxID=1219078 RepID=A0A4Y3ILG4_9VIBR|nr:hypothetical protein VCO01S_11580 [Vibrio comitans NBRC 102076]